MTSKRAASKSSVASDAYIRLVIRSHSKGIIQEQDQVSDKGKNVVQENQLQQQSASVASLSVQQLQDMITNSIRAQYGGSSHTSFMTLRQSEVAHCPLCRNMRERKIKRRSTRRKFVRRSLKGNAFELYTEPEPKVIDCWEQLENEFLNRFYSIKRTKWALGTPLHYARNKAHTFEELATHAHDMELSIASKGTKDFHVPEVRKDKKETKGVENIVKSTYCRHEQHLEKQLIQLPKCKRLEQVGKVDDPNYCKYHRVINVLEELILRLACRKKIELDLEELSNSIRKSHLRIPKEKKDRSKKTMEGRSL
ncbi:ty3-gypsy retrotransposon protein [Cucumis melo var. makuwa]|uniref:Ty3-gypsy retrotransposon protein n=1 Tax=Cucumis melo var. makuwa TaxID=1194695 RepID=A0A5A7SLS6_CUCMM|nr:ty3-gypsy retrotransposon protein [Cucumis melo var. makuwa]TYK16812.1 ty3-gypsy retrotransposon protein [Cucumis melo var. makuwa]